MDRPKLWTEKYLKLSEADRDRSLKPKDLETYALAAYLTGKVAESVQVLERAHVAYMGQNEPAQAVRCAFWLGMIFLNIGQRARGSGWMARGERLLDEKHELDCAEKGLFLIPVALVALASGEADKAQQLFEEGVGIGEKFADVDLILLGSLGLGQALVQQGKVANGLALLDENMITVETEEVFPVARGIVYCASIETCRKVWDLGRAREWTSALTHWCEVHPDIVPFRGQCLVRQAEIMQLYGEWSKALKTVGDACALLTKPPGEPAAGEAFYLKADLLRLTGDFEGAEECYREAGKWGRKPQPGLALLRLATGHQESADASISNSLSETKDITKRAELLPAVVKIKVATTKLREASAAAKELCGIADKFDSPYLHAMSSQCKASVSLAEGRFEHALEHLQKSSKLWKALNLPYESAHTKVLKGLVYRELKDEDSSDVEFEGASWIFEQLQASPDFKWIQPFFSEKRTYKTNGLTLRELQVLRAVAAGKTNKSVASELFISVRTVDRHVSNIFNKLGVSSRVEATTFAIKHDILDEL